MASFGRGCHESHFTASGTGEASEDGKYIVSVSLIIRPIVDCSHCLLICIYDLSGYERCGCGGCLTNFRVDFNIIDEHTQLTAPPSVTPAASNYKFKIRGH